MKPFKRIVAIVLVALCFVSAIAISAFADTENNTRSVYLSNGTGAYGQVRGKDNDTSIYLYINSAPTSHSYVAAYGCSSSGSGCVNLTCVDGSTVDYVICRTGVGYSVHSLVNEAGYSYTRLGFTALTTASGYLSYTWSPDSSSSHVDAYNL